MRRREFVTALCCATAWPLAAAAQQDGRVRRIGILDVSDEADRFVQTRWRVTREVLAKLGWVEGRNVRFDVRLSANDPDQRRIYVDELIRLAPDVIAVAGGTTAQALLQRTRDIPTVFTSVGDPVAIGLLKNIARPEGNATGIASQYQSLGGKWLELLKEAAPHITRVALIFAAKNVNNQYFGVIDAAAEVLRVNAIRTPFGNAADLERAIDDFAAEPNGGLIVLPPPPFPGNRELINRLALKHRLPTIYQSKYYAAEGSMMGYGADIDEAHRIAASYVDRILRGAKISELPVQFPTRFELVINLKIAAAICLTIPESLLFRADEVIK
jgi:putative tryptophan/tyrosine transport system substrate-binding protein